MAQRPGEATKDRQPCDGREFKVGVMAAAGVLIRGKRFEIYFATGEECEVLGLRDRAYSARVKKER